MKKDKLKNIMDFVENICPNTDELTTKGFENINYPLPIKICDGKKKRRYIKNISFKFYDWEMFCSASRYTPSKYSDGIKFINFIIPFYSHYGFEIYIREFCDLITILNPFLEMINAFKYKKNHFYFDYNNKWLLINHRMKIILPSKFTNNINTVFELKYRGKTDTIQIYVDWDLIYSIDNLFEYSCEHNIIDLYNKT